jgi:predicted nucleic acid-binding Zn ribbon protein
MNDAATYDALLDEGREPPVPCPVCTGDMTADPCGEECDELMAESARRRRIQGLYIACSRALEWARAYAKAGTTFGDARILAIADQVQQYRREIASIRKLCDGATSVVDIGYGQMVEAKRIRGRWVTQRTYWRDGR